MDEIAEYGIARALDYKQGEKQGRYEQAYRWVRELLEILEQSEGAEDPRAHQARNVPRPGVAFTPKAISSPCHEERRRSIRLCRAFRRRLYLLGAKVNGRIVPLKHALKTATRFEIITAKTQTPSPPWERFLVTGKAKSEIRRYIRDQQRDEIYHAGQSYPHQNLQAGSHELNEKMLEPALAVSKKKASRRPVSRGGEGDRQPQPRSMMRSPHPQIRIARRPKTRSKHRPQEKTKKIRADADQGLVPGMAIHYAGCCHPIPAIKSAASSPPQRHHHPHARLRQPGKFRRIAWKWIDVAGTPAARRTLHRPPAREPEPRNRCLASVANVIAKDEGNIQQPKNTNRSTDFFDILIDVK